MLRTEANLEVAVSPRTRRTGALAGGAAVLAFGAYAIGTQAGDGVAQSRTQGQAGGPTAPVAYGRQGPGPARAAGSTIWRIASASSRPI